MLHAYAITDSPRLPEGATGLDGAALRVVGARTPFAVVSEHDQASRELSEDDLWAHESVVEALMELATVLPMRFASAAADEQALCRILEERHQEFEALLADVRGAIELGVRAQLPPGDPETEDDERATDDRSGGPGTAYLLSRARYQRRQNEIAERIHEPLAALSRRSRHRDGGLRPGFFKAAYLVDRDHVDAFRAKVDELGSELGAAIVCTGPWPSYSFSSDERSLR